MSDMTLTRIFRGTRLADRASVHGFRSSFQTRASEQTEVPHAAMELSLAHTSARLPAERCHLRGGKADRDLLELLLDCNAIVKYACPNREV